VNVPSRFATGAALPARVHRFAGALGLAGLIAAAACGPAVAGTTGKIAGRVSAENDQPVIGATVALEGTALGAVADADGHFNILNVPPGSYTVRVTSIGYNTLVVKDVSVSADQTTRLDPKLGATAVAMQEVEVVATRPVVEIGLTNSVSTVTSEEIAQLPVQELQDVVNLQAGVVDGHFRGGRLGEAQYQVDGVSVNNVFDNKTSLRIDRSLIGEVQVISGTFDAEYGQAMSGVVNAVLKRGTETFEWSAEAFTGGYVFPGGEDRRLTDDETRPTAVQNYQVTLSGPTGIPNTLYLLNARRYESDGFVTGTRIFQPTDSIMPTGDGEEASLEFSREWSGALKLSNSSMRNLKLSYEAIVNDIDGRRATYAYRFNPDGLPQQETRAVVHGLDLTHTIDARTFYNLSLRQNYFEYKDLVYEDAFDPRYDAAGPPDEPLQVFQPGAILTGVDLTRVERRTNAFIAKGSLLSQVTREHLVKIGGEYQLPNVRFGEPGHLSATTVDGQPVLVRQIDHPDWPGVNTYEPVIAAAFAQDQIEWRDLTLRAGLRYDYFDPRSTVPSDPANPANAIEGAPESVPRKTTAKSALSPRLGVAYPVSDRAAVHFAYGHFRQFPAIGEIFDRADYSVLKELAAGGEGLSRFGVRGNPDIEPERTVQYEFGYKHAVTDEVGVDFTLFYKDIRDLLGVEFITTYNVAEYARLANADHGTVVGFTLALDQRRIGLFTSSLDYTWQQARGNTSDPRETATREQAGLDSRPRQVPLNWDQRHTLNLTLNLSRPDDFSVTTILRAASGQPYTPVREGLFSFSLENNSGRKPASAVIDVRAEKQLSVPRYRVSAFARVFNLLDTRFFNGFVFQSTGDPYYSRFPTTDVVTLSDPTRFYAPRRIEVGLTVGAGS
jgi:outer membrane receptor protein involved in Fe transport